MNKQSYKAITLAIAALFGLGACGNDAAVESSAGANDAPTVEVIATGANIAGANGMGLGPDGNLYVASVLGSNICT